jgi:hypothetical protein
MYMSDMGTTVLDTTIFGEALVIHIFMILKYLIVCTWY